MRNLGNLNSPWTRKVAILTGYDLKQGIWSRHPVKIEYKKSRRYKALLVLKVKRWVSDCEICSCQSRTCEVDHITAGGSFKIGILSQNG